VETAFEMTKITLELGTGVLLTHISEFSHL